MSRYNTYSGQASSWKINGASDPSGAALLQLVEPIILSWVAHCRQLAALSGLDVNFKYLTHRYFSAAWQMLHGSEVLNVTVYPPPEITPEVAKEIVKEPPVESFTPPTPPSVEEPETPPPPEPEEHKDEITPPVTEDKYFLVLFDNNKIMALHMGSLGNLTDVKPVIGPKELKHSNWTLPGRNTIIAPHFWGGLPGVLEYPERLPVFPFTLQMTNSKKMGPVAIASISIDAGVIANADVFNVFRLYAGFSGSAALEMPAHISVGQHGGFPALMSTDNMIYACTETFTVEKGKLVQSARNVWGKGDLLQTMYHLDTSVPFSPNFIDSDLRPHFDATGVDGGDGSFYMALYPALGGGAGFNSTYGIGGAAVYPDVCATNGEPQYHPELQQVDGVDVLRAVPVVGSRTGGDVIWVPDDTWLGGHSEVTPEIDTYGTFTIVNPNGLDYWKYGASYMFIVPYMTSSSFTYFDGGSGSQLMTQFGTSFGLDIVDNKPSGFDIHDGFMQVSNGHHNLQGFCVHGQFDGDIWPIEHYFFYLNGKDITSDLAGLCGTTPDKIQYAFMDVPLDAVKGLK